MRRRRMWWLPEQSRESRRSGAERPIAAAME
jgi:hypothetical protein